MNKLLGFCCALAMSLAPARAVDWNALKPQGYVSDFAGVIDAEIGEQHRGEDGPHAVGRENPPAAEIIRLLNDRLLAGLLGSFGPGNGHHGQRKVERRS